MRKNDFMKLRESGDKKWPPKKVVMPLKKIPVVWSGDENSRVIPVSQIPIYFTS